MPGADLAPDELALLRQRGAQWLRADDEALETAIAADELKEGDYGAEEEG